jgi:chromosome segregation ATPase
VRLSTTILIAMIFIVMLVAVAAGLTMRNRRTVSRLRQQHEQMVGQLRQQIANAYEELATARRPGQDAVQQLSALSGTVAGLRMRLQAVQNVREAFAKDAAAVMAELERTRAELAAVLQRVENAQDDTDEAVAAMDRDIQLLGEQIDRVGAILGQADMARVAGTPLPVNSSGATLEHAAPAE